jgi:transcriptional regulator of nitric oxide reductase
LEQGFVVANRGNENFVEFKSSGAVTQGLVARNKKPTDAVIVSSKDLQHAGLVLIASDGLADDAEPAEENINKEN